MNKQGEVRSQTYLEMSRALKRAEVSLALSKKVPSGSYEIGASSKKEIFLGSHFEGALHV